MDLVFNNSVINFEEEPLFFGKGVNVSRGDITMEVKINAMKDEAIGMMWFKNDFGYQQDGIDYSVMEDKLQQLYLKNLKFQKLLDSIAGRSVLEVFLPITTNPQLESWWTQHGFFETNIHSETYEEMIKALPVDAKKIFDDIMINPNILNRAKDITECFNDSVKWNSRMILHDEDDNIKYDQFSHMKSIVLSLYALNILEAGLFKTSFLTSFAFKENGIMNATGDAVTKINLDEQKHYGLTVYLINRLKKDPEWIAAFKEVETEVVELYRKAAEADFVWVDYLFEDDVRLFGISANILKEYVKYNMYKMTSAIGLPAVTEKVPNSCSWANKYNKISNIQTAQKEKSGIAYKLGIIDKDMAFQDWEDLRLEFRSNIINLNKG